MQDRGHLPDEGARLRLRAYRSSLIIDVFLDDRRQVLHLTPYKF